MSAESGMRRVSTTSTPIFQPSSQGSIEITVSTSWPVSSATACAARPAAVVALVRPPLAEREGLRGALDPSFGASAWSPVVRVSPVVRRRDPGPLVLFSSLIANSGARPSASPGHQSLKQFVLQLSTLFFGQLTRPAGLVDAFKLSTDTSWVVILVLSLLPDLLGQPDHSAHGSEW